MRAEVKNLLDSSVLYLYRMVFSPLVFPLDPAQAVRRLADCRMIRYDELAALSGTTLTEIERVLGSPDGCTHYQRCTGRYLMAVNYRGRNRSRVRWTLAHELGHIAAGHFLELENAGENIASPSELEYMEEEADYFAASLLAPFYAMRELKVHKPGDIRDWFGLSNAAAARRWDEFCSGAEDSAGMEEYFRTHYLSSRTRKYRAVRRALDIQEEETLL